MFSILNKQKNKLKSESGFTLIEMMVSLSLFSIVIVVMMGSILTIVDVNRKSQSLSIVMNDLNFVLESITRTIKTGDGLSVDPGGEWIEVINQENETITYRLYDGSIQRDVDNGGYIDLTSDQLVITDASFILFNVDNNRQPRLLISIEGEVTITEEINSAFKIQTTISQRNLDDDDLYN
jgi:prepilin-type N-terminal cleavage/methylation domain-containing protein